MTSTHCTPTLPWVSAALGCKVALRCVYVYRELGFGVGDPCTVFQHVNLHCVAGGEAGGGDVDMPPLEDDEAMARRLQQ